MLRLLIFLAWVATLLQAAVTVRVEGEIGNPARKAIEALQQGPTTATNLEIEIRQLPGKPESFAITLPRRGAVRITGGDAVGLAYGVYELLGQLESSGAASLQAVSREPALRKRSMGVFLYNQDLESAWLYDRAYWDRYFELLARSRFNYFTLIFGHQTSYLAPPFPFLIQVPGWERVRPLGLTDAERTRNLDMLRMVSEMAAERGIKFVFGIWQQHAHLYGKNMVEGLRYEDLFDYCPKALGLILRACPKIHGVQFRMNIESGIEEDDQNRFYTAMSKAIRESGRDVEVDYRAKGLRPETVESSLQLGIKPIVSTKYWREHMGLPFHGTRIDASDKERSYRRYGYWDLLQQNRPYDVAYRMWTLGSTKLLLWGSLDYARQFARSSAFGGSLGFEVCAPLSQKGFGNWKGGPWRIMAKPELEYYRWEFERYWAYYLSFGLAGYAAVPQQPILAAEFQHRFGAAATHVRAAYEAASWVIPFVTSVRAVAASNFGYWPEMETGGLTQRYASLLTGDDNRFYRLDEYVADWIANRASAKMTPEEMAVELDSLAGRATQAIERATAATPVTPELRSTQTDITVLASLARYHAARIRSALNYLLFQHSGERIRLTRSVDEFASAVTHWSAIVRATNEVYNHRMVFNRPPDQIGHWRDELPLLEAEEKRLREMARLYPGAVADITKTLKEKHEPARFKLTMRWKEDQGAPIRWADTQPAPEAWDAPVDRYSMRSPHAALREVVERFRYRKILHLPPRWAGKGYGTTIHASLTGPRQGVRLRIFHRPANSGFRFTAADMTESAENVYSFQLPDAPAGTAVAYYLRADAETAFFSGSEKEPHEVIYRDDTAKGPSISRVTPSPAHVGRPVTVTATIQSKHRLIAVRLHYRHLDQSEDWRIAAMQPGADQNWQAVIPARFVVPGWDLAYAIEAIDETGHGTFSPDWRQTDPISVIPVTSPRGAPPK